MSQQLAISGAEINDAHRLAREHAESAIEYAIQCGQLLAEAKSNMPHGKWLPWLQENVTFSARTARLYMRLAKEMQSLPAENRQRVANLPLRRVLQEIHWHKRSEKERQRKEAVRIQAKEAHSHALANGETKEYDLWTSPHLLLKKKTEQITKRNLLDTDHWREKMRHLVPSIPDYLENAIPQSVLDDMELRRSQMNREIDRRAADLVEWANEQRGVIAKPMRDAAETASDDRTILIARETRQEYGSMFLADIRNLGVPAYSLPHDPNCECGDAVPLGCLSGSCIGAALPRVRRSYSDDAA